MTKDSKDTIYVDIDDDIASIIDKVLSSSKKIIALVLPKRAAVFQSIVNMKLLKKAIEKEHKNIVLVTSDSAVLPLAGVAGLHVASTPQSKPEIPPSPVQSAIHSDPELSELDKNKTVGSLADARSEDILEVDSTDEVPLLKQKNDKKNQKKRNASRENKKDEISKKLKVPNFERFRSKLFIVCGLLVLLVVGGIYLFMVLPNATITLHTETSKVDIDLAFVADTSQQQINTDNKVLPAINQEFRRTDTEKIASSGQKNIGTKASGTVVLSVDCGEGAPMVPAGTGVSTNNLTFITQANATVASFPDTSEGGCMFHKEVKVVAQKPGDEYNFGSDKSFTVAGFSAVSATNPDSMTGGTTKIVKIVAKEDIDKATEAISKRASDTAPKELKDDINKEGFMPLESTLKASTPVISSSSKVGEESDEVIVTSTTVFTMFGVKRDDLKILMHDEAKHKIDTKKQHIIDDGIKDAKIDVVQSYQDGRLNLELSSTVIAGPQIDETRVKDEISGKKRSEIQSILKANPGIIEVEVKFSPFWVNTTPKNTSKITIVIEGKN